MIIVNRKRDIIINFSNVLSIYIQDKNVQALISGIEEALILGKYDTEERAKEVLEEIAIAYANITTMSMPKISIHEFIPAQEIFRNIAYHMPEK